MSFSRKKVIIALSGGVDSSAAAFILKKKNYDLIGIYFKNGTINDKAEEQARKLARFLKIPFFTINLSFQFKKEVIDYFIDGYDQGLTPNPCVQCNKSIKFGQLFKISKELGAQFLATGHYIKIKKEKEFNLYKPKDALKDQTYFLYNLNQNILKHCLFPLGEYSKKEIRKIAEKEKLAFLEKESQDICFLIKDGKAINHNEFLREKISSKKGPIKNLDEKIIGEHNGLAFYTIGQRKGIDIGGTGPYYALRKDYENNTLYVVDDPNHNLLFSKSFSVSDVNWINDLENKFPLKCEVLIRYRHKPVSCILSKDDNFTKNKKYIVNLDKPERAISPGQSAVFYTGNRLLGGGIISFANI